MNVLPSALTSRRLAQKVTGDHGREAWHPRRRTEAAAQYLGSQMPMRPAVVCCLRRPLHGYWRHAFNNRRSLLIASLRCPVQQSFANHF